MSNNYYLYVLLTFFITISVISAQTNPDIYINEFLSSNLTTYPDMVDFGDFSDWIELYNNENVDIDLGGYYLSDDFSSPTKWQIPNNSVIPAKGFFIILADGFDDIPGNTYIRNWWPNNIQFTTKWCHSNFKLNKDADKIGLFNASGNFIDSVSFNSQLTDVSFGRQPDGTDNWFYFGEPTPLKPNSQFGIKSTEQSGTVIYLTDGGVYQNTVSLVLTSSTGNGTIRYTTDGSIPTITSSDIYSSPINITENTVIRARLFESLKLPGITTTNSYFISESQNLPLVSLATNPAFLMDRQLGIYRNTYKEREIPISMEYFPLNSNRAFSIDAGAKIGGENIYRFAQKPLNIYARSNYGYPHIDYKIFDSQPFSEYKRLYLRNGGDDWPKTMMRDGMLGNVLRGKISNSTQAFKPAVLYLNGDYWGIYNLREKIDEQYFFLHYNTNPQNLDHLESDNKIISGDSTDFVNLLSFADANNLADPENYSYVKSRIDVFNLMDFVIVQDYLANSSWGHNREVWRDTKNNNLWRWILVDMDRGFNLSRISTNQLDDIYNNFGLFRNLCNNANFRNEFIQRYSYHINHTFNDDRVQNIIDSLKLLIEPEMPRHIQKWGTYIDSLTIDIWGQTSGISSITAWNSEIEMLKNFASQRSNYAVQYLNDKFNINGRANLKITTNISNEGKIYVNDYLQKFDDNNLYFKDVPLRIKAYPPPGYALKHWKEIIVSNSINIVPSGSQWKYWDGSSSPSNSWTNTNYVDDTWKMGNAQLGYGDGDENTVIDFGPNSQNKFITSYYRKSFQITDLSAITGLKINLLRDDGAIVYLNGIEIIRSNMPVGLINYSTLALSAVSNSDESAYYEFTIDKSNLVSGTNIIAVEVHQSSATSSDISFDLTLQANLTQQAPVENIVSLEDSIEYTIIDDTELIAEFEKISLSTIPASISGELNLTLANSPYFVGEDVIIQQSGILSAEPGVIIYFAKDKNIYTYGQLLIKGSLTQPITLTSFYPSETWGALCFANSIAESKLRHVNISRASHGNDSVSFFASVSSLNSTVRLSNVNFNNVTLPISSQYSNMIIDSCYFDNVTLVGDYINCNGGNITVTNSTFKGNNLEDMDAIDLGFMNAETNIHNNTFLDFTGVNSDGIDIGDACNNVSIKNNLIMNCADKGVSIGQGSTAFLYRNSITGCNLGVGIKDSLSYAEILNCTFFENYIGVACFIKHENRGGGSADIINTIIANSTESSFTTDISSNINISYSISNTDLLPGVQNIYDDPLMVNPKGNNLYLQVKSPCRDNGDPNSPVDEDGTRSDIGAFVFAGESFPLVVLNEINYNSSVMFDSDDWIEIYNNSNVPQDISGWVFISENLAPSFVFRSKTILDADSYLVLCHNLTLFKTKFPGVTNCLGDIISGLSGSGEQMFLYDSEGRLVDSLTYDDTSPWPIEADGAGSTLELKNPSFDNSDGLNWKASINNGTPGQINSTYVVSINQTEDGIIPKNFSLMQNFPNPFNPSTNINFEVPEQSRIKISVYDILGRKVADLIKDEFSPGRHSTNWNAASFSSGIYFIRLSAESVSGASIFNSVIKATILK